METTTKPIKILHIAHAVGGVGIAVQNMVQHLDANLFENSVLCEKENELDWRSQIGHAIKPFKVAFARKINLINDCKTAYAIYKIVRSVSPDIIHTHSTKAGVLGRIVAFFLKIKAVHTPHAFSFLSTNNAVKKSFFWMVEYVLSFTNAFIIAVSESEKNRALHCGHQASNCFVFRNAIPSHTTATVPLPITPNPFLASIARPSYQKNVGMMVAALAEIRKNHLVDLVVFGVGFFSPELETIQQQIRELSLEKNVFLVPWMPRESVLAHLSQAKIYLSSARYEGLPIAVLEAMSFGIPVVATNCDGNRDAVIHGTTGFLIEDFDSLAMASRVVTLLENKTLYEKMAHNAATIIKETFSIEKNSKELEVIYQTIYKREK